MYTPHSTIDKVNLMLDLVSQKQRALGMNLANIDTPQYVRKDLDFGQYLGTMNSPLETELSSKLGASGVLQDQQGPVDPVYELSEMQKASLIYSAASRQMSSVITQMKTVINVGK